MGFLLLIFLGDLREFCFKRGYLLSGLILFLEKIGSSQVPEMGEPTTWPELTVKL